MPSQMGNMDNFAVALVRSTVEYFTGSLDGQGKRATKEATLLIPARAGDSTLITRLGGLSAAAALGMGAYASYVTQSVPDVRKRSLENANKLHLIQSLGLILSHKAHYPSLTASLFLSGILLFCGPLYAYGVWNYDKLVHIAPFGNLLHMAAWLSFVF